MNEFPWGVATGLGLVLVGTIYVITWIMLLDVIEANKHDPKD